MHENPKEPEEVGLATTLTKIRESLAGIDYSLAVWAHEQRAKAQRLSIELEREHHLTDSSGPGLSSRAIDGEW